MNAIDRRKLVRPIAIALVCGLSACAATPITLPNSDVKFGEAVNLAKAQQKVYSIPSNAGTDGLDGKAARDAMILYQGTFKAPPPAVNVINIGGTIGK